jgi:hypothetical protein
MYDSATNWGGVDVTEAGDRGMAKNDGDGCIGCVVLVVIGAVVFVSCGSNDDDSEQTSSNKPATSTTQPSTPPEWRLEGGPLSDESSLWIDMHKSEELHLLRHVHAEDINSWHLDALDDDSGLTAADVELKILAKPKHGSAKLNKANGTVTYTPRSGFRGTDEIRYSLRLKGKPEVTEGTYSITVELSPGGRARTQFDNCAHARAAGAAPVREGEPGYGPHLDADGDGIGCDWG